MSAFILVFAHRFFAMTDDDGRYRLEGVPPGTYTLVVWNEAIHGDPPKRTVTIGEAGGDVDADFTHPMNVLLLAHQPDFLRHGAAGRAVDGCRRSTS
mgnify:CR=1 FL=1